MKTTGRRELITTPESEQQTDDLLAILTERYQREGRARKPKRSEAIRYAIAFTHKHLTQIINPEDLDK